jgi:hypothetical protein
MAQLRVDTCDRGHDVGDFAAKAEVASGKSGSGLTPLEAMMGW